MEGHRLRTAGEQANHSCVPYQIMARAMVYTAQLGMHQRRLDIKNQILELVNESLLVVVL